MLHYYSIAADKTSNSSVTFMLGKLSMRKKIKKGGNVLPKIFTKKTTKMLLSNLLKGPKAPYTLHSCSKNVSISD